MYWIIKEAKKARKISDVYVSTDSEKYRKMAIQFGAKAPFLRPKSLSKDSSKEIDYIIHMLKWLEKSDKIKPDIVVRLQATSPLQKYVDIDNCVRKLELDINATSSMAVSEAIQPPHKALKLDKNKKYLRPYIDKSSIEVKNRQNLPIAFYRSNIIASRYKLLMNKKVQIGNKSIKVNVPQIRSIDINTKFDLELCEYIAKKHKLF
jgi:CMP-N-acetylneuraminic acid synthetase